MGGRDYIRTYIYVYICIYIYILYLCKDKRLNKEAHSRCNLSFPERQGAGQGKPEG